MHFKALKDLIIMTSLNLQVKREYGR